MEMENKFSLEGLDQLIKNAEQMKKKSNDLKMQNFEEIIQGVARKYASKWCDRDDLEQDLWVKVLEVIRDCGGIENVDEKLVARVAYNRAVDLYRYHRRRYEANAEYIEGSSVEMDDSNGNGDNCEDYFDSLKSDKFIKGIDLILIKEAINLFSVGTRERKYIVLKLVDNGVIDFGLLDPCDRAVYEHVDGDTEADYIKALGYKSHCPGSWTCKKREIERIVKEYLFC